MTSCSPSPIPDIRNLISVSGITNSKVLIPWYLSKIEIASLTCSFRHSNLSRTPLAFLIPYIPLFPQFHISPHLLSHIITVLPLSHWLVYLTRMQPSTQLQPIPVETLFVDMAFSTNVSRHSIYTSSSFSLVLEIDNHSTPHLRWM